MMASASVLFSVMSLLVRAAKGIPGLTAYHSTLFRFLLGGLIAGGAWWLKRRSVRIVNWRWLIARGVFGGAAVLIYFYAITEIGLAKGTILSFTYPFWAGVLAPLVLGERLRMGLLAAVACAFGLLMVAYPALRDPMSFPSSGWGMLLGVGLLATAGQLLMTYAFKHVGATEGALLGMLTPVGNVVLGVLVFREAFTGRMILGGGGGPRRVRVRRPAAGEARRGASGLSGRLFRCGFTRVGLACTGKAT